MPAVVTEKVFAVVLATSDPGVGPLMLPLFVPEEVFAVVLAHTDPVVVPLVLHVVEGSGHVAAFTPGVHVVRMCSAGSMLVSPGACSEIGPCTSVWLTVAAMRCDTHMAAMSLHWT